MRAFLFLNYLIMYKQEYGIGVEAEGYFLNSEGQPVARIEGRPSSEVVMEKVKKFYPELVGNLSFELPSIVLEIKSSVGDCEEKIVEEILEIRQLVNTLLPAGVKLIFAPVTEKSYEFVASTSEEGSRAQQLIAEWGKTSDGLDRLYASAISSFQINDSRVFRGIENQQLEIARRVHNIFSENFNSLMSLNSLRKDFRGKTRMENYFELMKAVKGEQFTKRGFRLEEIVVPPNFSGLEAMKEYMMAHSDVEDFDKAQCKNEHAATVKIKRDGFYAVETRIFDAVDEKREMLQRIKANNALLAKISGEIIGSKPRS